jgi:hypothetical protein
MPTPLLKFMKTALVRHSSLLPKVSLVTAVGVQREQVQLGKFHEPPWCTCVAAASCSVFVHVMRRHTNHLEQHFREFGHCIASQCGDGLNETLMP